MKVRKWTLFSLALLLVTSILFSESTATTVVVDALEFSDETVDSRPQIMDLSMEALEQREKREPGVVREITGKRTANSNHYLMNDGSMQAVISSSVLHYETANGTFEPINTRLIDEADLLNESIQFSKDTERAATLVKSQMKHARWQSDARSVFRAYEVPFDVSLSKRFIDGYSIGKENVKLSFIPVGANRVTGDVYGDNAIRYIDAWQSSDVILEVLPSGIKETIVVKDESAPHVFTFELQGALDEKLSNSYFQLDPAWLVDANGVYRDVETRLSEENGKSYISLIADLSGLQYPISIDPTVNTFLGTQDATASNTSNYHYYTTLSVYNGSTSTMISYVQFDTSSIPSNAIVSNATLAMTQYGSVYTTRMATIYVRRATSPWTTPLYWNRQPSGVDIPGAKLKMPISNPTSTPTTREFDVTSAAVAWMNGEPNHGFSLISDYDNGDSGIVNFYRLGYPGYAPKLIINYNVTPGAPTVITPNGGEMVDTNYLITWASALDPDDAQAQLRYQVQLSLDGGSTWKELLTLSNAGANSLNYNFSSEANSTNAFIRVRAYDGASYGPWDQSNAKFTIKHNVAPGAPANTNPGGTNAANAVIVKASGVSAAWTFNDPDVGDGQSAYRLTVSQTNNTTISDTNWVTSSLKTHTLPSGLTRGTTYYWTVSTKDIKGATSPVSAQKFIKINSLPQAVISSYTDNQTVSDNRLTFAWTYSDADGQDQMSYQFQGSGDNWATIAYNTGTVNSAAASLTENFAQGEWDFRVRVFDGLEWSSWSYRNNIALPNSFEPNDTFAEAFPAQYGQPYTTLISSASDQDFYKWTANKNGIDQIHLNVPTGSNYELVIYDADYNVVSTGNRANDSDEEQFILVAQGHIYYAQVVSANGDYSSAPYTLAIQPFGVVNTPYQTDYEYDDNGNLITKTTTHN